MQRFFFPGRNPQSHRRSSSQGHTATATSNTRNMSSGTGHQHRYGQQNGGRSSGSGRSSSSSSSRRHSFSPGPSYVPFNDFLDAVRESSPFPTEYPVDSPTGPLQQSGSRSGPIPLDTSIQMTIIDDTLTDGRPLFYVMTCSLDDLDRILCSLCPSGKTIKFSTVGVPSMNLCSTKALDNFVRHGYSVTLEIGWKPSSPFRYL
ncbi:hypothetical protein PspLS_02683 [Pyricularia sp. CBS 133598]|nr:hypothetical protein PspLS_02683 [Pyricularia sp. CBS 133598]